MRGTVFMSNEQPYRRKSGPARLVIADDYDLSRAGLRTLLTGHRGLELVGEAANGREAVELCRRLQPDLALLDVRMPELDGLAACRRIKQERPATHVMLITIHENPDYLLEAIKAGAAGYVLKEISQHELIAAVWCVLRGDSMLNKELVMRVLSRLTQQTSSQAEPPSERLSPRELEVLRLLMQGKTNRAIACILMVS